MQDRSSWNRPCFKEDSVGMFRCWLGEIVHAQVGALIHLALGLTLRNVGKLALEFV